MSKRILGYEINVLTFSQAGEDIIIRNFFYERLNKRRPGFFVDIGAYHPYRHSNTFYLYRGGWRGINIDPRPGSMDLFNRIRPRDINLELAIADKHGQATYFDFGVDSAVINTLSTEYIERLGTADQVKNSYAVKTYPLNEVLNKHVPAGTEIDFMNIDIEGMELPALGSSDWEKYRPKLLACELYGFSVSELMSTSLACFLVECGYEFYARVILDVPKVNTVFFIDSTREYEFSPMN